MLTQFAVSQELTTNMPPRTHPRGSAGMVGSTSTWLGGSGTALHTGPTAGPLDTPKMHLLSGLRPSGHRCRNSQNHQPDVAGDGETGVGEGAGEPLLTSSVLYMPMPTPPAGKLYTSHSLAPLPSFGVKTILNVPARSATKSVALYCRGERVAQAKCSRCGTQALGAPVPPWPTWSPWACLPMVMGLVQPGTRRGMFLQMMGSRKTVPPRMFRMVPLGLFHIFFSLNSMRTKMKWPHCSPHLPTRI